MWYCLKERKERKSGGSQRRSLAHATLVKWQSDHPWWRDMLRGMVPRGTQHHFWEIPAQSTTPESNCEETPDKPTLRVILQNHWSGRLKLSGSQKSKKDGEQLPSEGDETDVTTKCNLGSCIMSWAGKIQLLWRTVLRLLTICNMDCGLDNRMVSGLNFLILITTFVV